MFQKSEKQKVFDYIAATVQHNIHILNELSEVPKSINVIENDGKKYIALDNVYKFLMIDLRKGIV